MLRLPKLCKFHTLTVLHMLDVILQIIFTCDQQLCQIYLPELYPDRYSHWPHSSKLPTLSLYDSIRNQRRSDPVMLGLMHLDP